jgi:molybdopterin converting factor small subunit
MAKLPDPNLRRISINLPANLHQAARMQAVEEDTTLTELVTRLVREYVENHPVVRVDFEHRRKFYG